MDDEQITNLTTTLKRNLIGHFPKTRSTDVINRPCLIGTRNQRTTQSLESYKSDLSLSIGIEDKRKLSLDDCVLCIFKKELMKYMVPNTCTCVLHIYYFCCLQILFLSKQNGTPGET
jgi:hypothetical protein